MEAAPRNDGAEQKSSGGSSTEQTPPCKSARASSFQDAASAQRHRATSFVPEQLKGSKERERTSRMHKATHPSPKLVGAVGSALKKPWLPNSHDGLRATYPPELVTAWKTSTRGRTSHGNGQPKRDHHTSDKDQPNAQRVEPAARSRPPPQSSSGWERSHTPGLPCTNPASASQPLEQIAPCLGFPTWASVPRRIITCSMIPTCPAQLSQHQDPSGENPGSFNGSRAAS